VRGGTSYPQVAAFDLLTCLLLLFVILALTQRPVTPPSIKTFGAYAVTATWADGANDDVDLYVRDPQGNICYFANTNTGLMNLEHDDLGTLVSGTAPFAGDTKGRTVVVRENGERTVIRGVVAGEYTVNVQMYFKADNGPRPVTISFWSLRGADRLLVQAHVTLHAEGDEATAFRVTVDASGNVVRVTHTPANLVRPALDQVHTK
jgi:hypothetical protein